MKEKDVYFVSAEDSLTGFGETYYGVIRENQVYFVFGEITEKALIWNKDTVLEMIKSKRWKEITKDRAQEIQKQCDLN